MAWGPFIELHSDTPEDVQRLWTYLVSQGFEGGFPRDFDIPTKGKGIEDSKSTYTRPIYLKPGELDDFKEHLRSFSYALGFDIIPDKQRFLHDSDYGYRLVDRSLGGS